MDIVLADTRYILFTTRAFATGIPTVLAGTPVVSAYENEGLTQITAGITLGVDHDGVVGLNLLTIVATGANGFEDDKDYSFVITTGTVGGVSVVGEVVGQFSIQRAPVNWANVSNPTTALDLSGTDIQLVDTASAVTGGATSSAQTTAQNDLDTITGSDGATLATAQGLYAPAKAGDNMGTVSSVTGNVDGSVASVTGAVGSVTGNVGGNVTGSVGSNLELGPAEVNAEVDTALADYDGPTNAELEARTPSAVQLLYITRHAATALPVTFTGGTTTTAVLGNVDGSAASTTDDVYNSRLLVFNAGTLNEQVCQITDYDGGTKTATISAVTTAVTSSHTAVLV